MNAKEYDAVAAHIDLAVENVAETLLQVSHAIHGEPELAFEEYFLLLGRLLPNAF